MGRASALLTHRLAAFVAIVAWIAFYYSLSSHLWNASLWWDVVFIGFVLIAVLAVPVITAIQVHPLWILADIPMAVVAVKLFTSLARDPSRLLRRLDETSG